MKIDRSEPALLNISEDPAIYTRQDCNDLLHRLAEGNRLCGGVNFVTKAYGIVGGCIAMKALGQLVYDEKRNPLFTSFLLMQVLSNFSNHII